MKFLLEITNIDGDKSSLWVQNLINSFIYTGFDSNYCDGELENCPNINIKYIEE